MTLKDKETISYLLTSSMTQITNIEDLNILQQQTPVEFITQTYCSYVFYYIIFENDNNIVTGFAFRSSLTDSSDLVYLGKNSFKKNKPMSSKKIMRKLYKMKTSFDA